MTIRATDFGYWPVASDSGIFAFADAGFLGSTAAIPLQPPHRENPPSPRASGPEGLTSGSVPSLAQLAHPCLLSSRS